MYSQLITTMIPTIDSMSSNRMHVVAIDRARQCGSYPWTRCTLWMLLVLGSSMLLHEHLQQTQLNRWEHTLLLGFMLSIGTCLSVWETAHWRRRCVVARTARAVHTRGCWHTCTVVVCADATFATSLTNALWAQMRRLPHRRGTTVLICRTPAELRPLLTMRRSRRTVIVTMDSVWSAARGGQP